MLREGPVFELVMPPPVMSANQTEPSGPIASRPSRTIALSSENRETSPAGLMCMTAPRSMSVYQALPSPATAKPSGSKLRPGVGSRSIRPPRTRPMLSAWSMVNQMVPSAAAAIATAHHAGPSMAYSTKRAAGAPPRISSAPPTISTTIAKRRQQSPAGAATPAVVSQLLLT